MGCSGIVGWIGRRVVRASFGLLFVGGAGCACNWHDNGNAFLTPYENGNFTAAAAEATRCAKDGVATDKVLLHLEEGAILRAAGKLPDSNVAFSQADALVGDYDQWPDLRFSEEVAAALTTVRNVNYRGYLSDLVMLNTYRALNEMELGQLGDARAALIRASFVQTDIADKYARALGDAREKMEAKRRDPKGEYDVQKTLDAPDAGGQGTVQDRLAKDCVTAVGNLEPYANYVNPFCDYVQGMFFMGAGGDASDLERASVAFRRVASMVKDNPYVLQDVAEAERVANGAAITPVTYVIFETGLAPERDQVQIALPLFVFDSQVPSVVIYFPTIHARDNYVSSLTVSAGGGSYRTAVVCDMDAVVVQEFKNQLPNAITRMLVGAATKAALDYASKRAMKDQDATAQLAVGLGMFLYQAAMNQADLRTWKTLPKQFQVARVPTPADRALTLSTADGGMTIPVNLSGATVNVVYVKSVRSGVAPTVRTFALN